MGTNTIQVSVGGKILVLDGGTIMRECCCTLNPCGTCYSTYLYRRFTVGGTTTNSIQTPVSCPSVKLTVTADIPPVWQASTAYSVGSWVRSTTGSPPYTYTCTVAGTSGATEPTWGPAFVSDNTVTWALGNFNISWCGKNWFLPEDSGKTYVVCPDTDYEYRKTYYVTTFGFNRYQYRFRHEWSNNPVGNVDLIIRRFGGMEYKFKFNPYPVKNYYAASLYPRANFLRVWNNNTDAVTFYQAYTLNQWLPGTVPVSATNIALSEIGLITTYTYPRWNNFKIPDGFFGSLSLPISGMGGGGALFTWEKGQDWP